MDRDTKLLYRQRGSNLRKTVDEDNILVIRTPLRIDLSDTEDNSRTSRHSYDGENAPVDNEFHDDFGNPDEFHNEEPESRKRSVADSFDGPYTQQKRVKRSSEFEDMYNVELTRNYDIDEEDYDTQSDIHHEKQHEALVLPQFDFTGLKDKQLRVTNNFIRSIESVDRVFQNVIDKKLVHKAISDFKHIADNNQIKKMMYKLDLKIFETFKKNLSDDLNDIKDINIANNKLLAQLAKLRKRRKTLTLDLIELKSLINEVTSSDNWFNSKLEQSKLMERLTLNENLNKLNNALENDEIDQENENKINLQNTTNAKLDTFIQLTNPYNGILNKLTDANQKLNSIK
ncbi:hypothetical protein KAFR_0G02330 [Kazachstania africana CBS 2517]|uniref:Inner kinetochore subunit AME1 domain-containing protein n=1 Tax=Kazachstania africana (strain ATCC 22294 / BCRC 22015 / CBS 2517 / CECT 1963 / NBRC 1671 / NRRL Y-8276) TaxID=1071382 RepID=H2AY17_KAZAF|nr:hypothetical protein KAFR_0G02330 [Kazachstania africana CBS 2517]CCF59267.1 hypothetical protein KAFR_0G02330 [Kazachstania africana CBS 2517]